jgi:hypothetical protein
VKRKSKDLIMFQPFEDFLFPPWQSVVLTVGGVILAILFLAVFVMGTLWSQKKKAEDKWHSAYCWTLAAFLLVLTLVFAAALSFVVEAKLGWQLSLLAGASVVLGAVSLGAGFVMAFSKTSIKYIFLWGTIGLGSFLSILMVGTQAFPLKA